MIWHLHTATPNTIRIRTRYDAISYQTSGGKISYFPYTDNPEGGYATIGVGFKINSNWKRIVRRIWI